MFSEDLTTMFDETYGFAVPASLGASSFSVIFDDAYYPAQGEEVNIETSKPRVTCKSSDVTGAMQGDTITIDGTAYTIIGKQPDGTGIIILTMEEA